MMVFLTLKPVTAWVWVAPIAAPELLAPIALEPAAPEFAAPEPFAPAWLDIPELDVSEAPPEVPDEVDGLVEAGALLLPAPGAAAGGVGAVVPDPDDQGAALVCASALGPTNKGTMTALSAIIFFIHALLEQEPKLVSGLR